MIDKSCTNPSGHNILGFPGECLHCGKDASFLSGVADTVPYPISAAMAPGNLLMRIDNAIAMLDTIPMRTIREDAIPDEVTAVLLECKRALTRDE